MGMIMVKCPETGRAIPTGIKSDRETFLRSIVFFGNTRCPICQANHNWFAREAWVEEPIIRTAEMLRAASSSDANDEAVLESASKFPFPDAGILLRRVRMRENISAYRRKANGRRDDPSLRRY